MPDSYPTPSVELVIRIARALRAGLPRHVDPDALISDGFLGLVHALRHFDPTRGIPFAAFAIPRVRGSILDGLRRSKRRQRSRLPPREADAACRVFQCERWEARSDVMIELSRLGRRQRVGLLLHYIEGLNLRETGVVLGMSEAGAGMLLMRAVRKLRESGESKEQPRGRRGPRGRHFSPHSTPDHR